MFYAVDNIRYYRAGGRKLTGSLSVEHHIAGCVAAHHNAIENIIHIGKLAVARNQHRTDDALQTTILCLADLAN